MTGASGRNWTSYGDSVELPADFPDWQRNLLTDPQTSGGLLVSCAAERSEAILRSIQAAGYPATRRIGRVRAGRTLGSGRTIKYRDWANADAGRRPARRSSRSAMICTGSGQAGPCLTDEVHRPPPERRPYVSRYAGARTLQQRSLRQILQVESSYLLCSSANARVGPIEAVSCHLICQVSNGCGGRVGWAWQSLSTYLLVWVFWRCCRRSTDISAEKTNKFGSSAILVGSYGDQKERNDW